MAKKKKPKLKRPKATKVKYEIDMVDAFDRAMADKPREVRRVLRPIISREDFKRSFGFNIIQEIVKRTLKGIDKKSKPFPSPYSDQYIGSDEFKIYSKSPFKVNLRLTGEMLASMKVAKTSQRKLKIIMADKHNNDKAHGHITGSIARIRSKAKRDFLGLPKDEENRIMRKTIEQFSADSVENILDFDEEVFGGTIGLSNVTGDDDGQ